jgi:hypothetical protein
MRALLFAALATAFVVGGAAAQQDPTGTCDEDLDIADFCATKYPGQQVWVQLTPITNAGGPNLQCSCGFASEECDPTNSTDPDLPSPCVPAGDTLAAVPNTSFFWQGTNAKPGGTCWSDLRSSEGKLTCLVAKPQTP